MATVYRLTGEKRKRKEANKAKQSGVSRERKEEEGACDDGFKRIRQKVLALSSRGVSYRQRHLLTDLTSMMPHSKKDAKFDTKSQLYQLNELAELYNCNNILFFEARKHGQDLYMWVSKPPNGPCVKFYVQNIHTLDELKMIGNCLKGSRPILSFDSNFDSTPAYRLFKELFTQIFSVPEGARRSKPFVDHVVSFTLADGKIWFRNYQIEEKPGDTITSSRQADETEIELVEIGPRFVLTPILVLEGSFRGAVIYENKQYVSPNQVRAAIRKQHGDRYNKREDAKALRQVRQGERRRAIDPLANEILYAEEDES